MSVENVKVGDKVRFWDDEDTWVDMTNGKNYEVTHVFENSYSIHDDVGDTRNISKSWDEFSIASLSANDTVRLKSGETFTTGSYTAEVDSVTDDKVILRHGSWLPLDAVEKVEHRFKVGDYVRVTDNSTPGGFFKPVTPGTVAKIARSASGDGWMLEGSGIYFYTDNQLEPAEPPKFKVGDGVRVQEGDDVWESTIVGFDGTYFIVEKSDGWPDSDYGSGRFWYVNDESLTLLPSGAPSQPSPREPLVVTLSLDASSFSRDLADQFQRIAEALRAA
ncbi:hypothetical protein [Ancylobacter polymorphus]|uniref:Uncharacterized protein n=1 Tax=Ancylobacter polymorphus TaxID=223390 RepID=A0A9E7CWY2_9HYPH|nr:hypothetical protein [Ancylobacter polymorphus]UOK71679.1 hypothetical protein K9D25_02850 [Ancylobacter polymorphus]